MNRATLILKTHCDVSSTAPFFVKGISLEEATECHYFF